ncbi:MAG: hypothetical protein U0795_12545 [Pirellulales bacterium]
MDFFWLYDMPTWKMVGLITGAVVGVTILGSIFVRPVLRAFIRSQPGSNELISYLLGSHGVYFGILLGLLALSAFENLNETEMRVTQEASRLAALFRDVSAFPEPTRSRLQEGLRNYTRYAIDEAWPLQRQGVIPTGGTKLVNVFQQDLTTFQPQTLAEQTNYGEALQQFNAFIEVRRMRLFSVTSGIPPIMWYVVLMGVGVNILLVWLLDMRLLPHLFLGTINTFFLATLIALVAAMDHPFRGEVSIGPEAFEIVYNDLMKGDLGTSPTPPIVPNAPSTSTGSVTPNSSMTPADPQAPVESPPQAPVESPPQAPVESAPQAPAESTPQGTVEPAPPAPPVDI